MMNNLEKKITHAENLYREVESAWCGADNIIGKRIEGLLSLARELREYEEARKSAKSEN